MLKKEREHYDNYNNKVNIIRPILYSNECKIHKHNYYLKNADKQIEQSKIYALNNKDKILSYGQTYRTNNRERLNEYARNNREINNEKITCECGSILGKLDVTKHLKTKKHQQYINHA